MLILAIETATESVGVALGGRDGVLASVTIARGRRHGETLAPAIQFACRHAGVELPDLDAVAVDIGPGLFTGMRVGIATAKALAMALISLSCRSPRSSRWPSPPDRTTALSCR